MSVRWGILATGGIAHRFAEGLKKSRTGELVAVGSRSIEKAEAFCAQHGGRAYGSYDGVLRDRKVDAVYIATPHRQHAEWTVRCAEAGKAILCEKPFTLNALEAQKAIDVVRRRKVFFMEAFMYRCHPQTRQALEWIRSGEIGEVQSMEANFGFAASPDWDNFRTVNSEGGGALMDVGVYPISFARAAVGEEPEAGQYFAEFTEGGVDGIGSGALQFPSGATAHFGCAIFLELENHAVVYGSKGRIHIENPWVVTAGSQMHLHREGKDVLTQSATVGDLYAFEIDAVAEFGKARECPYMTIDDTLGNMRTLDMLRASCGFRFEGEIER